MLSIGGGREAWRGGRQVRRLTWNWLQRGPLSVGRTLGKMREAVREELVLGGLNLTEIEKAYLQVCRQRRLPKRSP